MKYRQKYEYFFYKNTTTILFVFAKINIIYITANFLAYFYQKSYSFNTIRLIKFTMQHIQAH